MASTGLIVGVVLLLVLLAGGLLGFFIPVQPTKNNVPSDLDFDTQFPPCKGGDKSKGFPLGECRYSTQDVVDYIIRLKRFYQRVPNLNLLNFVYSCDFWEDFAANYSTLATFPLASNPDYQETVALRNLALSIKADPLVTTLEKIQIDAGLSDIEYYLNLSKIDHFVNQFAAYNYDYAWLNDRIIGATEVADTLGEDPVNGWCNGLVGSMKAVDPVAFDTRLMQWMANLEDMITDYQAAFQHQLDVNKTHAQITFDFQAELYNYYLTRDLTIACSALSDGSLSAQCNTYGTNANAAMAAFATFLNDVYIPACTASRPNSRPGLHWIEDGDAAYQVLLRYHLGFDITPDEIYLLGTSRIAQNRADMLATANLFDSYADFNALVVGLSNTADSRYYFCNTSDEDVINFYGALSSRIINNVNAEFGYVPRVSGKIGINGSPSTYNANGNYDLKRHFWVKPYVFNIGQIADDPEPNGCTTVYDKVTAMGTAMHENFPGHGLQVPLQNEIDCQMSRYQYAPTGFVEGWALYVESLGYRLDADSNPKGLYANPIDELGFFNNAMLRNNRLQEDPALNGDVPSLGANWDYDTAWQSMMNNGFTAGYAKSETERYVTMAGQATAYMQGRLKIESMRNFTETSLGSQFSALEFHNVLTRFGGASLENLDRLIHTYVTVKLSALPATDSSFDSLFGIDLIRNQFSATLPRVGL